MKKIILSLSIMVSVISGDVFDKGKMSVGIVAGSSYSYGEQYSILGVGVDYFLTNGLSVGVGYRGWFGGDPSINQLTLASSYYMPLSKKYRPYVGGFVRETFVNYDYIDNRSYESYGARGGLAINMTKNSYMSFGYVYEEYGNCTETIFRECSSSYPELVFSLAF
jgi:hypothetical protein